MICFYIVKNLQEESRRDSCLHKAENHLSFSHPPQPPASALRIKLRASFTASLYPQIQKYPLTLYGRSLPTASLEIHLVCWARCSLEM